MSQDKPDADPLEALRRRIDALDAKLIELLNERARVVVEVGAHKREHGTPIYAPHRESAVLKKVLGHNSGPLSDRSIEGIYRELMSGSFALEQPLHVGFLGPPGSFSHVAAVAQFGSSVAFDPLTSVAGVFKELRRGHIDYGIVPIENSTGGGIIDTLDAFFSARADLSVYAEVLVSIRHHLLGNCAADQVKQIFSKPDVFTQCREWIDTHFPEAECMPTSSSSQAVKTVRSLGEEDPQARVAAIGSELAGQLYGVNVLFADVEDNPNNITRFFVLAKDAAEASGDDKTSIMFATRDEPGALVRVLTEFEKAGVNLTHIDKRPSRRENWTYTFFIDAEGHRTDPKVVRALDKAKGHCQDFAVLGSYPRAARIL